MAQNRADPDTDEEHHDQRRVGLKHCLVDVGLELQHVVSDHQHQEGNEELAEDHQQPNQSAQSREP